MKYIIDLIDDIRENIQNAPEYKLVAMLLKEDEQKNLQNAGEKEISSFTINHEEKKLEFGFSDEIVTIKALLETLNSLEMQSMMYEVVLKISEAHPVMQITGFGENHDEKLYIIFVMV